MARTTPPVTTDRDALVARLTTYAALASKGGTAAKADILALCKDVPGPSIVTEITPLIGALKLGKWMPIEDRVAVVKTLLDKNRAGGSVTGQDVADLLGISTGQVSTDKNYGEDKPTAPSKSADQQLSAVLTALQKATAAINGTATEAQRNVLRAIVAEADRVTAALISGRA